MTESGRKFIETYKKESKAQAEREAAGTNKETEPEVNIAKIKDDPAENQQKDGGEKDIVSIHKHHFALKHSFTIIYLEAS